MWFIPVVPELGKQRQEAHQTHKFQSIECKPVSKIQNNRKEYLYGLCLGVLIKQYHIVLYTKEHVSEGNK